MWRSLFLCYISLFSVLCSLVVWCIVELSRQAVKEAEATRKEKKMEYYKLALEELISKLEDSGDDEFSLDEIQDYIDEVIEERKEWDAEHGR